ncbi:hypothetical protein BDFG_09486 [Blastomyces dermatitidis ATCC 26199]|nr:hypothetical protein BDFG_09486 [Blastomyces dermatitidis ATCC 26199]
MHRTRPSSHLISHKRGKPRSVLKRTHKTKHKNTKTKKKKKKKKKKSKLQNANQIHKQLPPTHERVAQICTKREQIPSCPKTSYYTRNLFFGRVRERDVLREKIIS